MISWPNQEVIMTKNETSTTEIAKDELSKTSEDFYPTSTWGLDYYFMIYNKMYIADVVQMKENIVFPGTYLYRDHPLFKVDIIGVVVKVEQNHTCFTYTVDDGTGVIPCCCWKKNLFNMSEPGSDWSELPSDLQGLASRITDNKIHEGYALGDLIQVRGKVKVFRDQREVVALYHTRLDDPMEEVRRLAELPKLYQQNYDQPFQLPSQVAQVINCNLQETATGTLSKESLVLKAKKVITEFFQENQTREITVDVLLKELESKLLSAGEQRAQCVEEALTRLQNEGKVCARREPQHYVIEVLTNSQSALEKTLLQILAKKCSIAKHADKGCHFLNLHKEACQTFQYGKVKVNAVRYCLTRLEECSDIIRTTEDRYRTMFT